MMFGAWFDADGTPTSCDDREPDALTVLRRHGGRYVRVRPVHRAGVRHHPVACRAGAGLELRRCGLHPLRRGRDGRDGRRDDVGPGRHPLGDAVDAHDDAATPTAPVEADLVPAAQGGFTAPKKAHAGSTITLTIAGNRAGQQVETFVFSTPTALGVRTVSAAQTISVTLPADIAVGQHRLLVRAADGSVIGWQPIEVVAAGGSLAATGADLTAGIGAALVLVLAGATLVVVRRRQQA